MKTLIVLLVTTLLFSGSSIAATCVSLGSGSWSNPATWSCGAVPSAGDNVTIAVGHTVTISVNIDMTGAASTINVDGVLLFNAPGAKLRLGCGSLVIISSTGSIQSSGIGQPSHSIRICDVEVWNGTRGTITGPRILGILLPIELTFFDAQANGTNIDFSWQTATEMNNDYFTIEGSSDGFNWNTIQRIDGAGTTQEVSNYSFQSSNNSNFTYFRLKQTDFDGNFSLSDIVSVELIREKMTVYPNPSNGYNIMITLPSDESGTLQILYTDGRVAYATDLFSSSVIQLTDIQLEAGNYLVQVQQREQFLIERLVVR